VVALWVRVAVVVEVTILWFGVRVPEWGGGEVFVVCWLVVVLWGPLTRPPIFPQA